MIELQNSLISSLRRRLSTPAARYMAMLFVVFVVLMLMPGLAWAGPGGQFAKALFTTTPGKIVLFLLLFVLLPLALWVWARQAREIRKSKRDLAALAATEPYFEWAPIEKRVEQAAAAIGHAWETGDLSCVSEYMTPDYHASQQALLDRWQAEGKRNVYEFHAVNKIAPIFVRVADPFQPPQISVLITASVTDYLKDVETGKVLKGKKKKDTDYDTVWVMVYESGQWLLDAIEDGADSLVIAMKANQLEPEIRVENIPASFPIPDEFRASQATAAQASQNIPTAQQKQSAVQVAQGHDEQGQPEEDHERSQQQR